MKATVDTVAWVFALCTSETPWAPHDVFEPYTPPHSELMAWSYVLFATMPRIPPTTRPRAPTPPSTTATLRWVSPGPALDARSTCASGGPLDGTASALA